MVNDAANQVLWQVRDLFRNSGIRPFEAGLLAFQLLVWAELSGKDGLDSDLQMDEAIQKGATGIADALGRLAMEEGVTGMAFSGAQRAARYSGEGLVAATVAAKRLADGGIFERFAPAQISADLFQSSTDSFPIPPVLASLMARLVVGTGVASVYCPWDSSAQVVAALDRHDVELYVETKGLSALTALLALFRKNPVTIALADPLRSPTAVKAGKMIRFDAAISLPPFGMPPDDEIAAKDIYGRFPVKKATTTGLMVQHILAQTSGTSAVVVPNSFLFGPGRDRDVREHLLSQGFLRAVVALPQGLFSTSNIPTALLLLDTKSRHDYVGFIDATQPHFRTGQGRGSVGLTNTDDIVKYVIGLSGAQVREKAALDTSLAIAMPPEAILAKEGSLQVDRYVMATKQRELLARMEAMKTVTLGEVAILHNPIPNKDRNSDAPNAVEVYEVGAADLPPFGYIRTPEKSLTVLSTVRRASSAEEAFLRAGDLVLVIKGSVGKVGIVPADVPPPGRGGWIAGQSAVVLRSSDRGPDLFALGLWLRSDMGSQVLKGIVSGATIPMISVQALRNLQVPVFSVEDSRRAEEVLNKEVDFERQIQVLRKEQADLPKMFWSEFE